MTWVDTVTVTVFWDQKGSLLVYFLARGEHQLTQLCMVQHWNVYEHPGLLTVVVLLRLHAIASFRDLLQHFR